MELSKYFKSESVELQRSQIKLAEYNPRTITAEAKKSLKRGIKKFGLVGGLIVNRQTGYTLVSGHQRLSVMDELQKYPSQDYMVRVDLIDVDEKSEKELNVLLNNPSAMGEWDYDALKLILPDIDYKDAGLTDADLSMIGVDYLFQTEEQNSMAGELDTLRSPIVEQREEEKQERQAIKEAQKEQEQELTYEEKKQKVKDMKKQIMDEAINKAQDMNAYIVLSFENFQNKANFCETFDLNVNDKYIKGEDFFAMLTEE